MSGLSAHLDSFTRDQLPARDLMPEFRFELDSLKYPDRINCAGELLDKPVAAGRGERPCLLGESETWSYADLNERANRIANVLTRRCGLIPGNRVLLRGLNHPMTVACWFGVIKAGGVAVATMPMLRAGELAYIAGKAEVGLALCDRRLGEDLELARVDQPRLRDILYFNHEAPDCLEALMRAESAEFEAVTTSAEDVCVIAFTSGTTGQAKGVMQYHRDMLAAPDSYGRHVLRVGPKDIICASPPLGFAFGLLSLTLWPMRAGASVVLIEKPSPEALLEAIGRRGATTLFTAPTAYRAMTPHVSDANLASLTTCISAGEHLPRPSFELWREATGIEILDGIGSTELFNIFVSSRRGEVRPGSTGRAVPGYMARVIDDEGRDAEPGATGRLAVMGPTGAKYLADDRQRDYVQDGWNLTGDAFSIDEDGYFWYQARTDDLIISSGYNIAGPEVEAILLRHESVADCAVVGAPDEERGRIVKAFIVARPGRPSGEALGRELQAFVKREIAHYKHPRAIEFLDELPRGPTGKVQRFKLREQGSGQ